MRHSNDVKAEPHPSSSAPHATATSAVTTAGGRAYSRNDGRQSVTGVSAHGASASDHRNLRSAAPSIDTRAAHQAARRERQADYQGGYGGEPVLMQVKTLPNSPPNAMGEMGRHNESFISRGFTSIGEKETKLNDALGELQTLGIQRDTALPELVLVGDQSAGKSSLMSALAGIYLPRNSGTCTRCPIHIRLSRRSTWVCKISLQEDYEYRPPGGRPVTAAQVTRNNPFGPWAEQPQRSIKEFSRIDDPNNDIETHIRWAQVAILNHSQDHQLYIPFEGDVARLVSLDDAESSTEASFSPNIVALDISGPQLPDLSFYDLPGVFINPKQARDKYLVNVVENLARKYISREQAIVLCTVAMNVDQELSSTLALIQRMKATDRTVGIMTKADLLPAGSHAQWLSTLRGEQHRVEYGYFITAQSPRPELKQDLAAQKAWEESFFNANIEGHGQEISTWPSDFHEFHDRCGVDSLIAFLSQKLSEKFEERLPKIHNQLSNLLMDVEWELTKLPELPPNLEVEVRRSLVDFVSRVKTTLQSSGFKNAWGRDAERFRNEVVQRKPRFVVWPDAETNQGPARQANPNAIDLTGDDDIPNTPGSVRSPALGRRRGFEEYMEGQAASSTPSKRRGPAAPVKEEGSANSGESSYDLAARMSASSPMPMRSKSRTLADVRRLISNKRRPGFPDLVTEEVYEELCLTAIRTWKMPLEMFIKKTFELLSEKIRMTLQEALSELQGRLIFREAFEHMENFLSARQESITDDLHKLYEIETRKVYTLDTATFSHNRKNEAMALRRGRNHYRLLDPKKEPAETAPKLRDWETMSEEERLKEDNQLAKEVQKLGPDPFAREMDVCAYVRGYYLTAAGRFVDSVTLNVYAALIPDIVREIEMLYLDKKLGLVPFDRESYVDLAARFENLMSENGETTEKRAYLKGDRVKFRKAIMAIESLQNSVDSVNQSDQTSVAAPAGQDDVMMAESV